MEHLKAFRFRSVPGSRWSPVVLLALLAALLTPAGSARAATLYTVPPVAGSLTGYHISGVYVSGLSSGADMAGQLQVAYSSRIKGLAVFGDSPYYCAQNNAALAVNACAADSVPDNLPTLEADASLWSGYGWIDPVGHLSGKPVYVFHGGADTAVEAPVSDDAVAFFKHFGANVTYDNGSSAGHAWVTPYGTGACGATASPYLDNCGDDPENALLSKVFGSVAAPNTGPLTGTLIRFDQSDYAVGGSAALLSMDGNGFAYVPASCAAGASCKLMVALHGCEQGYSAVGTAFVDRANLDQYADTNNMIVLYPQATASGVNPLGCWDWWGYLGATDYPIKGGAQIETIMNMVSALGG
jgi:poly(3-hydroxybutyrate) depolymerase